MDKTIIAVLLMAIVTYLPRVAPIVLLRSRIKSKFINSFLYYVPFAVLGAMIFPSILFSTGNIYSALAGMTAALILSYFEKGLMKVAVGAIAVVYVFEMIFNRL